MDQKTALEQAISVVGTQAQFARAIGASDSKVWNWLNRGDRVPAEFCPEIEKASGILCEQIRPDVDWAYLRNKARQRKKK